MPQRPPPPDPGSFYEAPGTPDGFIFLPPKHDRLTYWACGHDRRVSQTRSPFLRCPPCVADRKHRRKCIAGHIALLVLQFVLLGLFASGALR